MRDIETDTVAGKRTLAVRLGRRKAGLLYVRILMVAAVSIGVLHRNGLGLVGLGGAPLAVYPIGLALGERKGEQLLPLLGATAGLQIGAGLFLTDCGGVDMSGVRASQ